MLSEEEEKEIHGTTTPISSTSAMPSSSSSNKPSLSPTLSILNTVVEYTMVPPSPLFEPDDHRNQVAEVPVVNIFGPILKEGCSQPHQSACLVVHGAFPYLLARPRAAGPDGAGFSSLSHTQHIDWDCPRSVQQALPDIEQSLEEAMIDGLPDANHNNQPKKPHAITSHSKIKFIRNISIVMGRGFYTYCPGPPAPFLKIQYYNPNQRWRIKRQLEQGISLPSHIHPDPHQYPVDQLQKNGSDTLLRFHCYEAHIPPTMQFFKDYNLAGMEYVDVTQAYLRRPVGVRPHRRTVPTDQLVQADDGHVCDLVKETSCDVELDVSVHDILNIHNIMKESQPKDVHWRAVPSLQEIWAQERRRMQQLVAPSDDFLSQQPEAQPLTLRETKNTVESGAKLAREGMHRLVELSPGLRENFDRVLKDIVRRHEPFVNEIDRRIADQATKDTVLTPSNEQVMNALEDLAGMFSSQSSSPLPGITQPDTEHAIFSLASLSGQSKYDRTQRLSQPYFQPLSMTQNRMVDELEFTQRVDRGDSIVDGPLNEIEDLIDPKTLAPYAFFDEEDSEADENVSEEIVEQDLRRLTQGLDTSLPPQRPSLSTFAEADVNRGSDASSASHDDFSADDESTGTSEVIHVPMELCESKGDERKDADGALNNVYFNSLESWTKDCPWFRPSSSPPAKWQVMDIESNISPVDSLSAYDSFLNLYNKKYLGKSRLISLSAVPVRGIYVGPVKTPPCNSIVSRWQVTEQTMVSMNETLQHSPTNIERLGVRGRLLDSKPRPMEAQIEEVNWSAQQMSLSLTQGFPEHKHDQGCVPTVEAVLVAESSQRIAPSASLPEPETSDELYSLERTPEIQVDTRSQNALQGMANLGGRLQVIGGGRLKATQVQGSQKSTWHETSVTRVNPLLIMSVEAHVQCRVGGSGTPGERFALTPNAEHDAISAIVYIYAKDPGGGETIEILEHGCLFVPVEGEIKSSSHDPRNMAKGILRSLPSNIMGSGASTQCECIRSERQLLHRFASIVYSRDPDMLISWDTQSASGLGYIIERGSAIGSLEATQNSDEAQPRTLDMARLLSRRRKQETRSTTSDLDHMSKGPDTQKTSDNNVSKKFHWAGSGLGSEWDERVGAGAAAASIRGRLVFAAWKLVSEEVKHPNVSYQPAVVSAVLGRRIPFHDNLILNEWYSTRSGRDRWRVAHYRLVQAISTLLIFDALDVIGRAGEAARLSCVEFSQSFPGIRGSQYKVEGVLLRALQSLNSSSRGSKRGNQIQPSSDKFKTYSEDTVSQTQSPWKRRRFRHRVLHNNEDDLVISSQSFSFFFFSPSLEDANSQEALEVQALTLEPKSGHLVDPVVVCDFTALYPSLCIAYNLCYSTIAGKFDYQSTRSEMMLAGRTTGRVGPFSYAESRTASVIQHHIKTLRDYPLGSDRAYVAPTGSLFVSESVVKGVLPQVLDEILSTRAMLKKAAKLYKLKVPSISPAILRQIEARQLALKYVANVTYGYTSATFSGRCAMPLLADTIVECGRRTLTSAINLANEWGSTQDGPWCGAKCVYGDTDSLFIVLPGRSVAQAFEFGEAFCAAVTSMNPPPVQLKLEKVYHGTMLQTKKKYCGMKFEGRKEKLPVFEAKGIETIRRDQCALTQKILRNALVLLFRDGTTTVKNYLFRQWNLILSGNLPVSDFILTGRVRSKYRGGRVGPVQAALARRLAQRDTSRVVRHKERLAYVIVATPGTTFRLRDCVLTPMELLEQWDTYTIHSGYYISRHVNPALQRCLGLAPYDIDVNAWFDACPKPRRRTHFWHVSRSGGSIMISNFFGSDTCSLCGARCRSDAKSRAVVCALCRKNEAAAVDEAMRRLGSIQKESHEIAKKCSSCNLCFEDGETFAVLKNEIVSGRGQKPVAVNVPSLYLPLANCSCIDCPVTYERHRLREATFEARSVVRALGESSS